MLFPASGVCDDPTRAIHRLVVCTDLTSMRAGQREPDDAQSLIRLLLHLDGIDLEGILPGSGLEHGHTVYGEEIAHRIIDAYAQAHGMLVRHDRRYPAADALRAMVHAGQPVADRSLAPDRSVGKGLGTPASRHLVRLIDRKDDRLLHVCLWGGGADIAQALWDIQDERGPAGIAAVADRVLVHAIGDQDTAAVWAKQQFPMVPWITRAWGYRGMYRGGDSSLVGAEWIRQNLHAHGPLCSLYPIYNGGDIWIKQCGRVIGIKEGDTPSWLGLVPNGLHAPMHPEWGGWGGRMRSVGISRWTCDGVSDILPDDHLDMRPEMSTVHRWRRAVQSSFALRAMRCVRPPADVPSEPSVRILGGCRRRVSPGSSITIRAECGPDEVVFSWMLYPQVGTGSHQPVITGQSSGSCALDIPSSWSSGEAHLIVEARRTDAVGSCGYGRVLLTSAGQ